MQEVREGRLSEAAYADVEMGATKEDVLTALRPVLPVDTRVVDRYELRDPQTVAAECVYFDREDAAPVSSSGSASPRTSWSTKP